MIEILNAERCTECDICVRICPTNVFDAVVDGVPVIARQSDCQTCFQCEAYCPADAIFVAPSRIPVREDSPFRDEDALLAAGQLGLYRERVGWRTTSTADAKTTTDAADPAADPAADLPPSTVDYHRTLDTLFRSTP